MHHILFICISGFKFVINVCVHVRYLNSMASIVSLYSLFLSCPVFLCHDKGQIGFLSHVHELLDLLSCTIFFLYCQGNGKIKANI